MLRGSTAGPPSGVDSLRISDMYHPDQLHPGALPIVTPDVASTELRGCLQAGCPCRDARIVSHRKAAFFAAMARSAGETADRVIAPDPDWTLPRGDLA
jgi:hypothetical protein